MSNVILDFEKPVAQLEAKLAELERMVETGDGDFSEELAALKRKIIEAKHDVYEHLTPWQRVQLARHPNRPYTLDYIERIFDNFIEFHGDRRFADDPAIVGGFARIDGRSVMVIGTQKGRNTRESLFRNFGCPHPEGYRKAIRLMKMANLAKVPIITFIDTPGAFPGVASEERHIGEAIAVNLREMFALDVPVLSIVIGEGGSGGALGIGVGNQVLLMENAYYSVITPEGCAAILWKDRAFSEKAAQSLNLTANDLLRLKIIDGIVSEPIGGAHKDYDTAAKLLKDVIREKLKAFDKIPREKLKILRYAHFRNIKFFKEPKHAAASPAKPKKTATRKVKTSPVPPKKIATRIAKTSPAKRKK